MPEMRIRVSFLALAIALSPCASVAGRHGGRVSPRQVVVNDDGSVMIRPTMTGHQPRSNFSWRKLRSSGDAEKMSSAAPRVVGFSQTVWRAVLLS
jgi:hypothetical protein